MIDWIYQYKKGNNSETVNLTAKTREGTRRKRVGNRQLAKEEGRKVRR